MNKEQPKKPKLFIVGASGHGKVVAEIARLNNYSEIVFFDDDRNKTECGGYQVVGTTEEMAHAEGHIFIAIGNSVIREKLFAEYKDKVMPVLIHPDAVISDRTKVGAGTVIMAGAVINSDTVIGEGCIINTSASVDHDCDIGDFTHIAVGAHLCGTVRTGNKVWIGAGATVINNVDIASGCLIGAGAVVIESIEEEGTYVGVPANRIL